MTRIYGASAAAALAVSIFTAASPANAAVCTAITTADELQGMADNTAGNYCLKNDIDMSSISNFLPVGIPPSHIFTGTFDGGNHVIRNLKTNHSDLDDVGLFGLTNGATIKNVTLDNPKVVAGKVGDHVGALVGTAQGTTISNVHVVNGEVVLNATGGDGGGIAGFLTGNSTIDLSSVATDVVTKGDANAGGLLGETDVNIKVTRSYASGLVFCTGTNCDAGGLVGATGTNTTISKSFSTATVFCPTNSTCGGLVGYASAGNFSFVYASGEVVSGTGTVEGGLIGTLDGANSATLNQVYAIGLVGGSASTLGGLIGVSNGSPSTHGAYWDAQTSGRSTSAVGTAMTTRQMWNNMPGLFNTTTWHITLRYGYPYLTTGLDFRPQLATLVNLNSHLVFTFNRISQFDKSNYRGATNHIDQASLAACYTMIARAIGVDQDYSALAEVQIDKYFWVDATQKTLWRGPVTSDATLGPLKAIPANVTLTTTVVANMKRGKVVLLRGSYQNGGKTAEAWMLGTLFTSDENGKILAVIANDPFTGAQIQIDPVKKTVAAPRSFPLKGFKVDAYQVVTIAIP
ncbi:MAG: ZmpA/ZmpB/ZmpC family metallo-endopeptidase-related protein [Pseudolabrys sp.]